MNTVELAQEKTEVAFMKSYNKNHASKETQGFIAEIQNLLPKWTSNISEVCAGPIIGEVWDKIDYYINDESMSLEELAFYFNAKETAQALQNGIDEVIKEFFQVMIMEKDDDDYSPEFNSAVEKLINDFQLSTSKIMTPYLKSILDVEASGGKLVDKQPLFMETITNGIGTSFAAVTLPGLLGTVRALSFNYMYDKNMDKKANNIAATFDADVEKSFEQYDAMTEALKEKAEELLLSFWTNLVNEPEAFDTGEAKGMLQDIKDQIREYEQ